MFFPYFRSECSTDSEMPAFSKAGMSASGNCPLQGVLRCDRHPIWPAGSQDPADSTRRCQLLDVDGASEFPAVETLADPLGRPILIRDPDGISVFAYEHVQRTRPVSRSGTTSQDFDAVLEKNGKGCVSAIRWLCIGIPCCVVCRHSRMAHSGRSWAWRRSHAALLYPLRKASTCTYPYVPQAQADGACPRTRADCAPPLRSPAPDAPRLEKRRRGSRRRCSRR